MKPSEYLKYQALDNNNGGGGGTGGPSTFFVTFSPFTYDPQEGDTITADKTYAEILAAYQAGKVIVFRGEFIDDNSSTVRDLGIADFWNIGEDAGMFILERCMVSYFPEDLQMQITTTNLMIDGEYGPDNQSSYMLFYLADPNA